MTVVTKKIVLPTHHVHDSEEGSILHNPLDLVRDLEVTCSARIGTINLTIAELQSLKNGQVLTLGQKTHEPVEIIVNQKIIARGELISCDDYFAVRITEVSS